MFQLDFKNMSIGKSFLELRFKEVFSFHDHKYKILDKLSKKYPEVNPDYSERITLINPEKGIVVHVSMNSIIIDWDKPPSIEEFIKVARSIIEDVKRILRIEVLYRIGMRSFMQYSVASSEDATKYILSRYFSKNANNTAELADEFYNAAISLSGRKKSIKFNFTVNYQQHQVIQGSFNQVLAETVNHLIIADVDVFKDKSINLGNLEGFFKDAKEFKEEKVIAYLKNIEGISYANQF